MRCSAQSGPTTRSIGQLPGRRCSPGGERLRSERIEVYSAYAGAITEARRADIDRWWQRREAPRDSDICRRAKDESYRRRADARRELFRLQFLTPDYELDRLASIAYDGIGDLHRAESRAELEALADIKTKELGDFITCAREQLATQYD